MLIPRSRSRRRRRLRNLAGVAGVTALVSATRKRAIAANERRYGEELGLDRPDTAGTRDSADRGRPTP